VNFTGVSAKGFAVGDPFSLLRPRAATLFLAAMSICRHEPASSRVYQRTIVATAMLGTTARARSRYFVI
jgi:hypothetical protein